jgi:hypothetical protein
MEKLAKFCEHCGKTGLEPDGGWDPDSGPQPACRVCNGTGYELTQVGEELRKFVVAVLGDGDVRAEVLKLVQTIRQDIEA